MSVYHAIHESPYDDACPDCAGMEVTDDYARSSRRASRALLAYLGALVFVLLAAWRVAVWLGGNPR